MLFNPKHENRLRVVATQLQCARVVGPDLVGKVIAAACTRLPALHKAGKAGRIDQLMKAGAWTELALALIEHELPAWKLRRLAYEDGEWHCSLSKQPELPPEIDDPQKQATKYCRLRSSARWSQRAPGSAPRAKPALRRCRGSGKAPAVWFAAITSPEGGMIARQSSSRRDRRARSRI
jgi:hypothetical protein